MWRDLRLALRREERGPGTGDWQRNSRAREVRERVMKFLLTACAYLSIFTTFGIVVVLFEETVTVLPRRLHRGVLDLDAVGADEGRVRHPAARLRHAHGDRHRHSRGAPYRAAHGHLPERVCPDGAQAVAQAGAGDPGRRAHRGLRVLRPDLHHPVFQGQLLPRHRLVQRALRRAHHGRHDHPDGRLGQRGRHLRGAAQSEGGRLRARRDAGARRRRRSSCPLRSRGSWRR